MRKVAAEVPTPFFNLPLPCRSCIMQGRITLTRMLGTRYVRQGRHVYEQQARVCSSCQKNRRMPSHLLEMLGEQDRAAKAALDDWMARAELE
jgi:hypothetical protein